MLRKIFILPILVFAFIALTQLLAGDFFYFSLWAFVTLVSILTFYGVIKKNTDDKFVPVIQISVMFVAVAVIGMIIVFSDVNQLLSHTGKSVLASFTIGIFLLGAILIARGKDQ